MNNKIKTAFDNIHADQETKEVTLMRINQKRHKKTYFKSKLIPAAVALFLTIGACVWGYSSYVTPVTVLSIDINPSLELGINRFDKVVAVYGYNEDGSELKDTLDIKHSNYKSAIDKIMKSASEADDVVSITVCGDNEKQKKNILTIIETISKEKENVLYDSATKEDVATAHEKGLSCGKYKAYLKLLEQGYEITEEEIKDMPMKDIRDRLKKDNDSHNKGDYENGNYGEESNVQGNGHKGEKN